jgi:hypothetical protein
MVPLRPPAHFPLIRADRTPLKQPLMCRNTRARGAAENGERRHRPSVVTDGPWTLRNASKRPGALLTEPPRDHGAQCRHGRAAGRRAPGSPTFSTVSCRPITVVVSRWPPQCGYPDDCPGLGPPPAESAHLAGATTDPIHTKCPPPMPVHGSGRLPPGERAVRKHLPADLIAAGRPNALLTGRLGRLGEVGRLDRRHVVVEDVVCGQHASDADQRLSLA